MGRMYGLILIPAFSVRSCFNSLGFKYSCTSIKVFSTDIPEFGWKLTRSASNTSLKRCRALLCGNE